MSADERLAQIAGYLEQADLTYLVMGGHAVRFHGWNRDTSDFDLHLASERWDDLAERLARTPLADSGPLAEGASWRKPAFRRFQIGRLEDGREEWLEFWRGNHLLDPFPALYARREEGEYGGRRLAFLSLPDLIRSKETERPKDWGDVAYLEEFLDARQFARLSMGRVDPVSAFAGVRSQRGFESILRLGESADPASLRAALAAATNPITWAYLAPLSPGQDAPSPAGIEPLVARRLRTLEPGSAMHLALVSVVRRAYRTRRQAEDAADKQAILAANDAGR